MKLELAAFLIMSFAAFLYIEAVNKTTKDMKTMFEEQRLASADSEKRILFIEEKVSEIPQIKSDIDDLKKSIKLLIIQSNAR